MGVLKIFSNFFCPTLARFGVRVYFCPSYSPTPAKREIRRTKNTRKCMKKVVEKLSAFYNAEKRLGFQSFDDEDGGQSFHGHFHSLYKNSSSAFGGDHTGAVYVFPRRICRGRLFCRLLGRGKFAHYDCFQSLPLEAVAFYDEDCNLVEPEEALGGKPPRPSAYHPRLYHQWVGTEHGGLLAFGPDKSCFYLHPMTKAAAKESYRTLVAAGRDVVLVKFADRPAKSRYEIMEAGRGWPLSSVEITPKSPDGLYLSAHGVFRPMTSEERYAAARVLVRNGLCHRLSTPEINSLVLLK